MLLLTVISCAGCSEISRIVDPDNHRARADSNVWASKNDIIKAASQCGIPNFKPMEAGGAWAAYTDDKVDGDGSKEECIYEFLGNQGLLVTR